ncbi:FlhC family transcriptional regulator [Pseudomonas aeruginosa]
MSEGQSYVDEMYRVQLAIQLIKLGGRIQIIQSATKLKPQVLNRLFKEITGVSPQKGLLPYSTEWFLTWMPNIHSSLFYNIYLCILAGNSDLSKTDVFIRAYRLYLEQIGLEKSEFQLPLTRAWFLVKFFEGKEFGMVPCKECGGRFVAYAYTPCQDYTCGICKPPSRAGKPGRKGLAEEIGTVTA